MQSWPSRTVPEVPDFFFLNYLCCCRLEVQQHGWCILQNQEFGLELEGEIVQFIKEFATPQILNFSNRYQLLKKCYSDIFIKENLIDGIWHEERNKVLSAKNHLIQTWQNHHTKEFNRCRELVVNKRHIPSSESL